MEIFWRTMTIFFYVAGVMVMVAVYPFIPGCLHMFWSLSHNFSHKCLAKLKKNDSWEAWTCFTQILPTSIVKKRLLGSSQEWLMSSWFVTVYPEKICLIPLLTKLSLSEIIQVLMNGTCFLLCRILLHSSVPAAHRWQMAHWSKNRSNSTLPKQTHVDSAGQGGPTLTLVTPRGQDLHHSNHCRSETCQADIFLWTGLARDWEGNGGKATANITSTQKPTSKSTISHVSLPS